MPLSIIVSEEIPHGPIHQVTRTQSLKVIIMVRCNIGGHDVGEDLHIEQGARSIRNRILQNFVAHPEWWNAGGQGIYGMTQQRVNGGWFADDRVTISYNVNTNADMRAVLNALSHNAHVPQPIRIFLGNLEEQWQQFQLPVAPAAVVVNAYP